MPLTEETLVRTLLSERASLLAYIWSIVRDGELVEDVFQEVSLLAVRNCAEFREEKALPTWLRRTARFRALAALRDRHRDAQRFSDEVLDKLDACWDEHTIDSTELRLAALRHCLPQLSPRSRHIVALRYIEGLSSTQVAERLGRNVRTIYVGLTRIHKALRECMQRQLRTGGALDG